MKSYIIGLILASCLLLVGCTSESPYSGQSVSFTMSNYIHNDIALVGPNSHVWIAQCSSYTILIQNISFLPQEFECQLPCNDSQCVTYTGTCYRTLPLCNTTKTGLNCMDNNDVTISQDGRGNWINLDVLAANLNPAPVLISYTINCTRGDP